jgi:hypothetical protein
MKGSMQTRGALLAAVVVVAAVGCRREAPDSPEGAYRGFIEALQRGNARKAWSMLSPGTREQVQARARAIAETSRGVVRDEPESLLFQGTRPGPLGEVTQVSADEQRATLRVASASGTREVKLVKNSGKWLIDLSDNIERRGSP